ncbi:MAG: DMT family transporter [Coriobacteriia bacterium]|nr:DMT family transporter [Coriobacteriia bacterium]
MSPASLRWLSTLGLVAVCTVWGGTFVMVKDAVSAYPAWSFIGLRFLIATIAFALIFPKTFRLFEPGTLRAGLVAGVFLTAGYVLQTLGLAETSPSKAAFITGMFVVITPFMQAVFMRRMPRWTAWLGVATAVAGLWLLSGGGSLGGWNRGDTLVLLCAVAYSAHMIVLGSVGRHDARPLAFVQLATCALVTGTVGLLIERPPVPTGASLWTALLVTGVLASAVAFAIQTYAQKHLSPTRTALILICEPAFGGLFGWWLAHEQLGVRGWAGAALILAGMAASEVLAVVVARKGEATVLEPSLEGPPAHLVEPVGEKP